MTYFWTQGDKYNKRCIRLKISFLQGPDTYNSSSYFSNETDEPKRKPDYSSFHPDEIDALKDFYRPTDTNVPHDQIVYVKETTLCEVA